MLNGFIWKEPFSYRVKKDNGGKTEVQKSFIKVNLLFRPHFIMMFLFELC
jgi:hypothetical protein